MTICLVPVPFFVMFLLQNVNSGNILGIGQKFMTIFYWTNKERSQKGDPGGAQPSGGSHLRVTGGPRPPPACAPRRPPRDALWHINHPRRENPNSRRIFPNTIQSSAAITDKFWGVQKVLFRHPAGTGIDRRSHLHQHRCFPR